MQYDALVFDLDGTLIDSAPDITAAINRSFAEVGWPQLEASHVVKFIGNGSRALISDILADQSLDASEAQIEAALERYLAAYRDDPAGRTHMFDHVREDLSELHAAGVRLGICTNKPHALAAQVLAALELDQWFEVALGADAVPACKPDPGHLRAVAEKMELTPGRWAYVGDSVIDQAVAQALNVDFFVVPWGTGPQVPVEQEQRLTRLRDLLRAAG